jgi:hypothetical protein
MEDRALPRGNASLAVLHTAQAAVILALSTDFSLPVTGAFMEGQPGSGLPKQDLLFDLRIGPLVGAFLLLAALDLRRSAAAYARREHTRAMWDADALVSDWRVGPGKGRESANSRGTGNHSTVPSSPRGCPV